MIITAVKCSVFINLEGELGLEQAKTLIFADEEPGVKKIRDFPTVPRQAAGSVESRIQVFSLPVYLAT